MRFLADGPGRAVTLASLVAIAYAILFAIHQRYLSHLGLSANDVGLSRDQLLGGPVLGLIAATLLTVLIITLLSGTTVAVLTGLVNLMLRLPRRLRLAVGLLGGPACLVIGVDMALEQDHLVQLIVSSVLILVGAGILMSPAGETVRWTRSDAPLIAVLFTASLCAGALGALALGYKVADVTAARIEDGRATGARTLMGLPILASEAQTIRWTGPLRSLDRDARRHRECLLYVGHGTRDVLWDVRRRRSLRAALAPGAFELTGHDGRVPAHCAPETRPRDDDGVLVDGRAVREVHADGNVVGWEERIHGNWVIVLQHGSARLLVGWRVHRPHWDVGPGVRRGTRAVALASCASARCSAAWTPAATIKPRRLPLRRPPGCWLGPLAVAGDRIAVAWTGARCADRGLWLYARGHWRRQISLPVAARITSLDLSARALAWTSETAGTWQVVRRRLDGTIDAVLTPASDVLTSGDMHLSAVMLHGRGVRWAQSSADDSGGRGTAILEDDTRTCVIVRDLPGRPDGSGVDGAVTGGQVIYATGRLIGERRLLDRPDCNQRRR